MPKRDIEYSSFQWHFGVVEDRNDPSKTGRVRVRFYGVHSDDLSKLPTDKLPWATVMQPPTSTANSGKGGPITGIIEGSWVVGFFIDEGFYQKPLVLGCLPGQPFNEPEPDKAFNDPNGIYPSQTNEPDSSKLARGNAAEKHYTLRRKRIRVEGGIKTAKAPELGTFEITKDTRPNTDYEADSWNEPEPRGYLDPGDTLPYPSKYPFNYVFESENNTIFEIDDTPGAQRINMEHGASGTFQEIQHDGSRITKIYGKDYEIVAEGKNVKITGGCNVTIKGDAKLFIDGDKYEEVTGSHYLTIYGDKHEKIQGNFNQEIGTDRGINVGGNNFILINNNNITTVKGDHTDVVGGKENLDKGGESFTNFYGKRTIMVTGKDALVGKSTGDVGYVGNVSIGTTEHYTLKSVGDMKLVTDSNQTMNIAGNQNITASVTNINNDLNVTGTIDASVEVKAGDPEVKLTTHKHTANNAGSKTSGPDNS